jgi:hypothetical protein
MMLSFSLYSAFEINATCLFLARTPLPSTHDNFALFQFDCMTMDTARRFEIQQ